MRPAASLGVFAQRHRRHETHSMYDANLLRLFGGRSWTQGGGAATGAGEWQVDEHGETPPCRPRLTNFKAKGRESKRYMHMIQTLSANTARTEPQHIASDQDSGGGLSLRRLHTVAHDTPQSYLRA